MEQQTIAFPQIITERPRVPNMFPIQEPGEARIALIGEAPGEDEENVRVPFYGRSGRYLNAKLAEVGIDRARCFVGNICQVRPPGNKISWFPWTGEEIQSGLAQLKADLDEFNPTITILLGNTPLHAAKANCSLRKGGSDDEDEGKKSKYPFPIFKYRGSLFIATLPNTPFTGRKCIPSLHPANVLRQYSGDPLLHFDLSRALDESRSPALILPQRELLTNLDPGLLCHLMDNWPAGQRCSVDIEGGLPENKVNESVKKDSKKRRHIGWRCVSLSADPSKAFAVAWWRFNEEDHCRLLQSYARLMYREDVPKVLQNSLYDNFVQCFGYGIPIRNVVEDTMLKGWEIYCELPKGLGVQASIWTREPHWKDEEMYETTGDNLAVGCCKDTAVTIEICSAQDAALNPILGRDAGDAEQRRLGMAHYRKNIEMLSPLLYMELRGIRYDTDSVAARLKEVLSTGWTDDKGNHKESLAVVGERLCQTAGTELRGKKGCLSDDRLVKALYDSNKYPKQYKKEAGRKTEKVTTDQEALLHLNKHLPNDQFLKDILYHRHLESLWETLSIQPDADGRVRCAYNVVGTETGRLSCKTSPTGAGANLTTITKELRSNYISDPQYDFFQCDLAGADGWTVAAHCARLGDRRMLDDYLAGLKPAKIIALLRAFGFSVNALDTESLLWWSTSTKQKDGPFDVVGQEIGTSIYDCCKVVQHGTNYGMQVPTMQVNVMKKSYKGSGVPIYMEFRDGTDLRNLYLSRYTGLPIWHSWAEAQLVATGCLTSACGHTRKFMGRRIGQGAQETHREFLAHEPQINTTYATNLAMLNLWNDPENRYMGVVLKDAYDTWIATLEGKPGALFIEPLHSVHDALCGQGPSAHRPWVRRKLTGWFNNALEIAGERIVIPFEGGLGPSWGKLPIAV